MNGAGGGGKKLLFIWCWHLISPRGLHGALKKKKKRLNGLVIAELKLTHDVLLRFIGVGGVVPVVGSKIAFIPLYSQQISRNLCFNMLRLF